MKNRPQWRPVMLIVAMLMNQVIGYAQNPLYKVYAIKFSGTTQPFSVADWAEGGPKTEKVGIDFMVWLIKGNNGRNILVDAGFLGDTQDAKDFGISNYIRPDSAVLKVGVRPTDITDIIISHPHWDHIGGVGLFPGAQIWMQKEDFEYFVGTAWQKGGHNGGFSKQHVKQLVDLNLNGKLNLVDGDDKQVIPGITVYTGSKHTANSQYVLVKTGSNNVILASDNIWIYYSLDHMVPAANGGTLNPQGYVNAIRRMKSMVTDTKFIIPGHDAAIFSRFPAVADGVVEIK